MFNTYSVSWVSIILATVASFIIGWVWYSNGVFGKTWMKMSGISGKTLAANKKKGMAQPITISLALGIVSTFVLANILSWLSVSDTISALRLALWLWLGFIVPIEANKILWEGKPWGMYFISLGHHLLALSASAVILSYWI